MAKVALEYGVNARPPSFEPSDVACPSGAIHIELPGEIRISLEGSVDQQLVRAVPKSLHA